jgi:methionyl-tRNA synthetase
MEPKRYTITAALPYTNGPLHIGHLAGAYLPADVYARFMRLRGEDVVFICGSDEHGVPITIKAKNENRTPQEVVDEYHAIIKKSFDGIGVSFDKYFRTSDPLHHETATTFFEKLYNDGKLISKESQQLFDPEAKQFLADRYVEGGCPKCDNEAAYGDQCEKCGASLNPTDLINPKSKLSGATPVMRDTKHWYLPLDEMQAEIQPWIESHQKDWKSNVMGQCKSWLNQGLQPRAVTRDLDWGVKVPVEGADGKVMYVWFDAPIGYISATKKWAEETGNNWEDYWKKEDSKLVHFIGKDNIVFHCIIFPAMLMAHGNYVLPDNVPANEFLNLEGDKISTSRNWAVWLHEYLEDFPGKEDVLRYTLLANAPESKDNDFKWKDFQSRNKGELVDVLGNFVNRIVVLSSKYYDGKLPAFDPSCNVDGIKEVQAAIKNIPTKVETSIEAYRFKEALSEFMRLAREGNKFLADTEPWRMVKEDPKTVESIMHLGLQLTANLAILSAPFIPFTTKKLLEMLNMDASILEWKNAGRLDLLPEGHVIGKAQHLFNKIEDEEIEKQLDKLKANQAKKEEKKPEVPAKSTIQFDDFTKLDLKVGTIQEAEKVPKADKLLKLLIDVGTEQRTILSGIAEQFSPEELLNKQVVVLTNLAPRKMRGVESQGMVLMAEDEEGKLQFVKPESAMVSGAVVR